MRPDVALSLPQPTEQRQSNVRTQQKLSGQSYSYIMRKVWYISSNLNSNLLWFHCVRPNVHSYTNIYEWTESFWKFVKTMGQKRQKKTGQSFSIWSFKNGLKKCPCGQLITFFTITNLLGLFGHLFTLKFFEIRLQALSFHKKQWNTIQWAVSNFSFIFTSGQL